MVDSLLSDEERKAIWHEWLYDGFEDSIMARIEAAVVAKFRAAQREAANNRLSISKSLTNNAVCAKCGESWPCAAHLAAEYGEASAVAQFTLAVETEQAMHRAWRKRAEEAERELIALRAAQVTAFDPATFERETRWAAIKAWNDGIDLFRDLWVTQGLETADCVRACNAERDRRWAPLPEPPTEPEQGS